MSFYNLFLRLASQYHLLNKSSGGTLTDMALSSAFDRSRVTPE